MASRVAFFVLDALSPGAVGWARAALSQLGHLLALSVCRPPPIGLAVLQRRAGQQSTQLQVRTGARGASKHHRAAAGCGGGC